MVKRLETRIDTLERGAGTQQRQGFVAIWPDDTPEMIEARIEASRQRNGGRDPWAVKVVYDDPPTGEVAG